jgi:hypothetical protein
MERLASVVVLLLLLALTLLCGIYAACGWMLMTVWNFLIGSGFHGPLISFWDGTGMIVLVSLLAGYLFFSSRKRRQY